METQLWMSVESTHPDALRLTMSRDLHIGQMDVSPGIITMVGRRTKAALLGQMLGLHERIPAHNQVHLWTSPSLNGQDPILVIDCEAHVAASSRASAPVVTGRSSSWEFSDMDRQSLCGLLCDRVFGIFSGLGGQRAVARSASAHPTRRGNVLRHLRREDRRAPSSIAPVQRPTRSEGVCRRGCYSA